MTLSKFARSPGVKPAVFFWTRGGAKGVSSRERLESMLTLVFGECRSISLCATFKSPVQTIGCAKSKARERRSPARARLLALGFDSLQIAEHRGVEQLRAIVEALQILARVRHVGRDQDELVELGGDAAALGIRLAIAPAARSAQYCEGKSRCASDGQSSHMPKSTLIGSCLENMAVPA